METWVVMQSGFSFFWRLPAAFRQLLFPLFGGVGIRQSSQQYLQWTAVACLLFLLCRQAVETQNAGDFSVTGRIGSGLQWVRFVTADGFFLMSGWNAAGDWQQVWARAEKPCQSIRHMLCIFRRFSVVAYARS